MPVLPDYHSLLAACDNLVAKDRENLEVLLALHGVASEYIEFSGNTVHIPLADRVDILQFKGLDIMTDTAIDGSKIALELDRHTTQEWNSVLPAAIVLSAGEKASVTIRIPDNLADKNWHWSINGEDGSFFTQEFIPSHLHVTGSINSSGVQISARELHLPPFKNSLLACGYHEFILRHDDQTISTPLIVAPSRCHLPDWVLAGKRLWGFSVQLYTLRSPRNWGMGDFSDLRDLIVLAAANSASFLVLNPLHALDIDAPDNCSPYSPNDRRRLNILYIDPACEPEFIDNEVLQTHIQQDQWQQLLEEARSHDCINYRAVCACKREVLTQMFLYFVDNDLKTNSSRAQVFHEFVAKGGKALESFAAFEAARLVTTGVGGAEADPRFTLYTQWLAERQLESCQQLALAQGMRIGLIRDLAVGGDGAGAEINLNHELFCQNASIGAPPDPLAPQGQNWGLPPLIPEALQLSGYRHFIELLQSNMAHCGALRIDHVMALMRLWWCPRYVGRGVGAYVHYPVDDLFALLRLESMRNRCLVIGEDLGVVPPQVRGFLDSSGVFSNVLFYFEKYDGFHFKRPQHYNPRALAMVANHDVPTLAAWWNGTDLRLRHELGLIPDLDDLKQAQLQRATDKHQVWHWLAEQWLLPPAWQEYDASRPFDGLLCAAIFQCSARNSSQLLSLQLEDLALLETPVNIPGTSSEYPNWRRRLPLEARVLISSVPGELLLKGVNVERSL